MENKDLKNLVPTDSVQEVNNEVLSVNLKSAMDNNLENVSTEILQDVDKKDVELTNNSDNLLDVTNSISVNTEQTEKEDDDLVKANDKKTSAADLILKRIAEKNKGVSKPDQLLDDETKSIPEVKNEEKQVVQNQFIKKNDKAEHLDEALSLPVHSEVKDGTKAVHLDDEFPEIIDIDEYTIEDDVESAELVEGDESISLANYASFSKEELVNVLKQMIETKSVLEIKNDIESIKVSFYKKHNTDIAERQPEVVEVVEEGVEVKPVVQSPDPLEVEFKDLLRRYKELRANENEKIEKQKTDNLNIKYQIIEEIKDLVNRQESINKTFQEFRDLQKKWRETGLVPQSEVKTLWETYHHHVENFYDYIKINKELRDLDLKRNLETKLEICEKAEELFLESSVIKAFRTLQKYHAQWRESGPVPREKKDELWDRFKEATTKINRNYQQYFEKIKDEQEKNLQAKTMLCEKAEELAEIDFLVHKDWEEKSNEIIELQKMWKLIGFAPKKYNNKIYERFRIACDKFFNKKRDFYSKHKDEQNNNLQLKTDLCMQAEELKTSTDWKKTTELFVNMQKQWKEIGPVPKKHSDALWKRFRSSCNLFFDQKKAFFSKLDAEQDKNLKLKLELIAKIENFDYSDNNDENVIKLKEYQKEWTEIGHVPLKNKDEMQKKFRLLINKLLDRIKVNVDHSAQVKFKTKIESIQQSPKAQTKLKLERDKMANKLKELESDIVLWENNIGFFAKSKNAQSLIEDVKGKIEKAKKRAEQLRDQLKVVDGMDNKKPYQKRENLVDNKTEE